MLKTCLALKSLIYFVVETFSVSFSVSIWKTFFSESLADLVILIYFSIQTKFLRLEGSLEDPFLVWLLLHVLQLQQ